MSRCTQFQNPNFKLGFREVCKLFLSFAIFMECHKCGVEFASVEFFMRHEMRREYVLTLGVL